MDIRSLKIINPAQSRKIKTVNISLSPENEYNKNLNQLPKFINFYRSKHMTKSHQHYSHIKDTYSIAYIGESSGVLAISIKKLTIPKISKKKINENPRSRINSPTFILDSSDNQKNHKYFRPKPLTPASIKLFDFSEYKHRSTSVRSRLASSNKKLKNESFDMFVEKYS